jgi:hypothetical protein
VTATEIRFENFIVREADPRNWVLERDTGRPAKNKDGVETGGPIIAHIGYYDTPEAACRSAIQQSLRGQGLVDAKAIIARIDRVFEQIHRAVRSE